MRRTHFPALVLTGLLATALTGCGEEDPSDVATDPASSAPTSSAPTSESTTQDTASSAPTSQPTEESTNVRTSENITLRQPAEGATVSGSFVASGKANSPEANVPWQVLDANGNEVLNGFATADGWMDKLYPWRTEVDVSSLDPGTYTFVAMTADLSGGSEGPGAEKVSATIIVE